MHFLMLYFFLLQLFTTIHIALSADEGELDIAIYSPMDNKVITASGISKTGLKLANVTLEKFANLPTQIWSTITLQYIDDTEYVVWLVPQDNEQNTLTSYVFNGAHSNNDWRFTMKVIQGLPTLNLRNERNKKCLNNKGGKLYYSKCDVKAQGQKWILKIIA